MRHFVCACLTRSAQPFEKEAALNGGVEVYALGCGGVRGVWLADAPAFGGVVAAVVAFLSNHMILKYLFKLNQERAAKQ